MSDSQLHLEVIRSGSDDVNRRAQARGPLLADLRGRAASGRAHDPVTVRFAAPADERELEHLAALDSAQLPPAPLLVGERAGRPVAALSLADGAVVADPFVPTADVVALLALRARQVRTGSPRARGLGRHRGVRWRLLRAGG